MSALQMDGAVLEWTKIVASGLIGFAAACSVQGLSVAWQECTQKARLRRSLYRELTGIYTELRDLLAHLKQLHDDHGPTNANLAGFVKAECYDGARSSPVFWRLSDAFGIVEAHRNFQHLALRHPPDTGSTRIVLDLVLSNFRNSVKSGRLDGTAVIQASDGRVTEVELTEGGGG